MDGQKSKQTFEITETGKLRVSTEALHQVEFDRAHLEESRTQKQNELIQIIALLAKMDELGVE